ncbi:MAG: glycosyltransferase family 2 protein [Acidobacteria bacterium]|nr:glycosyltransferase family 2 protein [Acidobacteriota bacterium]MBV9475159.1 glycosyltransferase family 2 protein [Acidobacteriota bacterium]
MTERVCVLIPALNAERTLPPIVADARRRLEPVVVIDDGSRDRTGDVARAAGAQVLRHEVNRGKGGALKTGFAWALANSFDAAITLDADGQHLPGEIPKFLAARAETGADLIIGGRAHLFAHMLPRRRAANRFSAWCIAKTSGTPISDSQSGFRLYSASLLRRLTLRTDGFDMESEVIVRAGRSGLKIVTIPIELGFVDGISTSHYRPLKDTLRIAWTVTRSRFFW